MVAHNTTSLQKVASRRRPTITNDPCFFPPRRSCFSSSHVIKTFFSHQQRQRNIFLGRWCCPLTRQRKSNVETYSFLAEAAAEKRATRDTFFFPFLPQRTTTKASTTSFFFPSFALTSRFDESPLASRLTNPFRDENNSQLPRQET